jgi:hypothetical protein
LAAPIQYSPSYLPKPFLNSHFRCAAVQEFAHQSKT